MDKTLFENLFNNYSTDKVITKNNFKAILNVLRVDVSEIKKILSEKDNYTYEEYIEVIKKCLKIKDNEIKLIDLKKELVKKYDVETSDFITNKLYKNKKDQDDIDINLFLNYFDSIE
jgi:hypothetical protein